MIKDYVKFYFVCHLSKIFPYNIPSPCYNSRMLIFLPPHSKNIPSFLNNIRKLIPRDALVLDGCAESCHKLPRFFKRAWNFSEYKPQRSSQDSQKSRYNERQHLSGQPAACLFPYAGVSVSGEKQTQKNDEDKNGKYFFHDTPPF